MSELARLHQTSASVMDSALKTGFALMKANYVERDAPEWLDGKIQGLAPEARDIAVNLRDSISARFESLRFHHVLMERLQQGRRDQLTAGRGTADGAMEIWSASWHGHYLFDDVVLTRLRCSTTWGTQYGSVFMARTTSRRNGIRRTRLRVEQTLKLAFRTARGSSSPKPVA